jgi:hypothetical protein
MANFTCKLCSAKGWKLKGRKVLPVRFQEWRKLTAPVARAIAFNIVWATRYVISRMLSLWPSRLSGAWH